MAWRAPAQVGKYLYVGSRFALKLRHRSELTLVSTLDLLSAAPGEDAKSQ